MADDDNTTASLPSAFADADEPEPTEQRAPKPTSDGKADKTATRTETGLKSSGVPTARLLGWAVPVLGVVAGVAMYNQSPMLAAGVFAVAFFVALLMLVGHLLRRRGANSGSSRGDSGGRGGNSSPRARRRWLPWSHRDGSGGRSAGSTGSAGGSRGSGRRGLFNRGGSGGGMPGRSGIGRKSSTGVAGTGHSGSSATSGTKRSLIPFRRNRGAKTGTGSPAGTKSTTSAHGSTGSAGGTPRKGIRGLFRRNPTGHAGSSSTTTGHAGTSRGGGTGKGTGTGGGSGRRNWFRRNGNNGGTPKVGGNSTGRGHSSNGDKPTVRQRLRDRMGRDRTEKPAQAVKEGIGGEGAKVEKPKRRWWRRNKTEAVQTEAPAAEVSDKGKSAPQTKRGRKRGEGKAADATIAEPSAADQRKEASRRRKETERTLKELGPIDDMGFQLVDTSKVKPTAKTAPRKAVNPDPIEVDDCGFPIYTKVTPITKNKENTVALDTTQYTSRIDYSTPQTLVNTLSETAGAAYLDASKKDEVASDLRRSAANLACMKGMEAQAENLLKEAAAAEQDAEARRGMAAGLQNQASQVPA